MGLLSKLKSVFGLGQTDHRESRGETQVTVEREPATPDATSERAVKEADDDAPTPDDPAADTETATAPESETTSTPDDPQEAEQTGESVERIKGIGPTYAERLGAAGIHSIEQLAAADSAAVAAETELSEARLEKWIERAKAR